MTIFCKSSPAQYQQRRHDDVVDDVMVRIPDPPPPPTGSAPSTRGTLKDSYSINLSYRPSGRDYEDVGSSAPALNDTGSTIGIGSTSTAASSFGSGSAAALGARELVERKTQQRTIQQVTKVTKVYTTRRYEPHPPPISSGSRDEALKVDLKRPTLEQPIDVSTTMLTGPPQTIEEKIITEMYDPTFGSPRHEEITYRYSPMPPPLADLPFSSYPPGIGPLHLSSTSYTDQNDGEQSSGFSSSHTHKHYDSSILQVPSSYGRPPYLTSTLLTNPDDEDYPISESGAGTLEPLRNGSEDTYYEPSHFRRILNFQHHAAQQRVCDRASDCDRDEELAMLLRAEADSAASKYRLRHKDDPLKNYPYTDDSNRSSAILHKDSKNGYRECGTDDEIPHHNSCDYQDSPRLFPTFPRSLNNHPNHGRYIMNGNGPLGPATDDLDEDGGIMIREMPDREICNRYYPYDKAIPPGKASWRDPDIAEVVEYLSSPDNTIRANAAAYLQHLCYHDDRMKNLARKLGAIPILIQMLNSHIPDVQRNACGALRNMAYGRVNEENKKLIMDNSGIPALVSIFKRTPDENLTEVISGLLWNMSSYEEIKRPILETCLQAFNESVIIPQREHFEKEKGDLRPVAWSTIFRNVMGVIRNCSSDGVYARKLLRETPKFVHALFTITQSALARSDCDNKSIENCVCTLRNLSYRLQETVDLDYEAEEQTRKTGTHSNGTLEGRGQKPDHKQPTPKQRPSKSDTPSGSNTPASSTSASTSDYSTSSSNLKTPGDDDGPARSHAHVGCFGAATGNTITKNSHTLQHGPGPKEHKNGSVNGKRAALPHDKTKPSTEALIQSCPTFGILWDPGVVVKLYLGILRDSANPLTLEAAAGALQNLAACYWQPSIDIRTAVRKEKGLPILVELIKLDNDKVVCAVVTALRNLSMDVRNKELIGKYAMRELISKLPNPSPPDAKSSSRSSNSSDETISAVLAVLHQVILENPEFAQSLMEFHGIEKLVYISQNQIIDPSTHTPTIKSARYASQVLAAMWKHKELRDIYIRAGWKENVFDGPNLQKANVNQNGINKDPQAISNVTNRNHLNGGPRENNTLMRPISSQGPSVTPDRTPLPNQRGPPQSQAIYANKTERINENKMHNQAHSNMNGKTPTGYAYEPIYTQVNKKPGQTPQYGNGGHRDVMIPMEKMEIRADGKSRYDQCASDSWV